MICDRTSLPASPLSTASFHLTTKKLHHMTTNAPSSYAPLWTFIDDIVSTGTIIYFRILFPASIYKKDFMRLHRLQMFKTSRNLQYYHTLDLKINSKSYSGWSKSTGYSFKRLASVFIFVGNVLILLFPSILNILIMSL